MDFLCTRKDHPTAGVIYENVRNVIPNLSLGTVYRNLALLASNGQIKKIDAAGDTVHYDADTSRHQHFICRNCGAVEDIFIVDDELLECVNKSAMDGFDGQISDSDIYFYGCCRNCMSGVKRAEEVK